MTPTDNPPAFPCVESMDIKSTMGECVTKIAINHTGMSLRDYLAAKAMQAQISFEGMEGCDKAHIAAMAYELADALLAARKEGK